MIQIVKLKIGYITGDGVGTDIMPVAIKVIDAAIKKTYDASKKILWQEILIGEKAKEKFNNYLPERELKKIEELKTVLKGPLTTPIGGGFRSLNVTIRQQFDLYSCIRPVKYFKGIPSPMKKPELVDIVIFRENTEDVYSGIEWSSDSNEANELIKKLNKEGYKIFEKSAIGIKPISPFATKRLIKSAIEYAIEKNRKKLTLVHKGNIMKFTEGAFKRWGYEFLKENYSDKIIFEEKLKESEKIPEGKIIVNERITDAMFQQLLLRPNEYDVVATMNLNGDYLSDAAAAQVGGLGIAPGANIGKEIAIFEATHGTAPKYKGQDKVNPSSIILSGVMMLEYLGLEKAAKLIVNALEKTFLEKKVTYDLHRQMEGATLLKTSEFGYAVISNM